MNALGTLGKLAQKPSDKKIRITRVVFALLLILVIVFGWNATDVKIGIFDYVFFDIPYDQYILPILFIFPAVGLIRGIFDPGLFRKAIWKWVIFGLGVAMMVLSIFFLKEKPYTPPAPVTNESGEITRESLAAQNADMGAMFAVVSTDNWLWFFGFITTIVGFFLTGRNLTTKNEKYGETIKKIRV